MKLNQMTNWDTKNSMPTTRRAELPKTRKLVFSKTGTPQHQRNKENKNFDNKRIWSSEKSIFIMKHKGACGNGAILKKRSFHKNKKKHFGYKTDGYGSALPPVGVGVGAPKKNEEIRNQNSGPVARTLIPNFRRHILRLIAA